MAGCFRYSNKKNNIQDGDNESDHQESVETFCEKYSKLETTIEPLFEPFNQFDQHPSMAYR